MTDQPAPQPTASTPDLEELAATAAAAEGCEVVAVELLAERGGRLIRLVLDRPEGGLQLDHCAAVSERLSALLDLHDPIGSTYRLEVSSPGLTRPLKKREEFIRFQGRLAALHLFTALPAETLPAPTASGPGKSAARKATHTTNRKLVKGILQGMEEDDVLIEVAATCLRIPLAAISKAHLDFEF
ncbi:MAG: ribosome maturation factor RimP [Magnetococcales bacterium]|nr:ribosome maturation factor RimP [Magnetococcales bacterium]